MTRRSFLRCTLAWVLVTLAGTGALFPGVLSEGPHEWGPWFWATVAWALACLGSFLWWVSRLELTP